MVQLRRGWKDSSTGRDDWAEYEADPNHIMPLEGELVLEYDDGVPRLKIGNGISEFSDLPYISVDSFILPKPISITLYSDKWEQATDDDGELIADTYKQVVIVDNAIITPNSKVDLNPTPEQLATFFELGVVLTTVNTNGTVATYVVGDVLTETYTIQAVVTEVIAEDEVTENE
ncbi:MAG: hypothetical protein IJY67_10960 [Paludibacteraceae bacterium]|nr:hypothetical protein [Paludibacteraceae bacterium]